MSNWSWNRKPKHQEELAPSKVSDPKNKATDLEIEKKWLQWTRVEPSRFSYFYHKYYESIFKYFMSEVNDVDLAQELTHEVFSIAIDKLDEFKWQGYSFGAWLYRIAYNLNCVDKRQRQRSPEVPWNDEHENVPDSLEADHKLEQSELLGILAQCINNLDPVRRGIVKAHYWSGLKVREISLMLDQTESSVKNHLSRGRKQLQRDLLKNGIEQGLSADQMIQVKEMIVLEEGWSLIGDEDNGVSE